MALGHHSVLRIKQKSWTAGFGKDKSKGNYVVAQKTMELELTWKDCMSSQFIPFVDQQGHQGMRILINHQTSDK